MLGQGGDGGPGVKAGDGHAASAEAGAGRLAGFLQTQKESFLADLDRQNLKGWTLAMGNEAGGERSPYPREGSEHRSPTQI